MTALEDLQNCVTNDLSVFRHNYFPDLSESFTYTGRNPKIGEISETRYRIRSLDPLMGYLLAGNVGGEQPSDYARSVHFHNVIFRSEDINGIAYGYDVEPLKSGGKFDDNQPNFTRFMDAVMRHPREFLLLHVTDPYKAQAFAYATRHDIPMSESSKISGVVNPFIFDARGNAYGENVDGYAMMQSIEDRKAVKDSVVLMIGAGGVASSIGIEAASRLGSGTLVILNRTEPKAHALGERLRDSTAAEIISGGVDLLPKYIGSSDVIISAITENPYITKEIASHAPPGSLFADVNYGKSALTATAGRETGHEAIDGGPMVYHGVVRAAEIAFGRKFNRSLKDSTIKSLKKEAGIA